MRSGEISNRWRDLSTGGCTVFGRRLERSTLLILLLVLAGLTLRIAWNFYRPTSGASGEAFNVASAIADGRGFADSFQLGQGPTAHLLPTSPLFAGLIYRAFGVNAPIAEFLLSMWSLGLVFGAFLLLFGVFARLGTPRWARIGGLGFLCLAPAYIAQEAVDFRIWEGGLAVFLTALFLNRLLRADMQASAPSVGVLAGLSAITALLFFVNPPLGLGAYACALLYAVRRLSWSRTFLAGALAICALALLVVPWTVRNALVFEEAIPMRSNTGLEMAIAQHPAAASGLDRGQVFLDRLKDIHPAQSQEAYRRMQAVGGEVAYSAMLGEETRAWMAAHPKDVLRISLRHIRQIFAPEPWQYTTFGSGKLPGLRAGLASIAGLLGAAGLLVALARRRAGWIYPAMLVLVTVAAIAPFQPVPRYNYLFYPLLAYCAADLVAVVLGRFSRSPAGAGAGCDR